MITTINSGGTNVLLHTNKGLTIGMEQTSLEQHLKKHPDVATTPGGYLEQAAIVLRKGQPYKQGMVYNGMFTRTYESSEIGCPMILTVHRKFPHNAA